MRLAEGETQAARTGRRGCFAAVSARCVCVTKGARSLLARMAPFRTVLLLRCAQVNLEATADVTSLLRRSAAGDVVSRDRLYAVLYEELKRCAGRHLRRGRDHETLRTTALVHETFCRLVEQRETSWEGRSHFMAVVSICMRRVVVDYARARLAGKRGGGWIRAAIDVEELVTDEQGDEIVALHEALAVLEERDPPQAKLVEMRYFGGYTVEECAVALGFSTATAAREWELARAWLYRRVKSRNASI